MGKPQRKAWKQQNPSPATYPAPSPVAPLPAPVKTEPRTEKTAGLEKIREAIKLLSTHSASNVGGGMLYDAITLLESGYASLKG
jgi:hypothetical protein